MGFIYILALICLLNFQKFLTAKYTDLHQTGLSTYIVKVDVQPDDLESWYGSVLRINPETTSTSQPQILYHYRHVFSGFAAKLSENDVEALRLKNGIISASRERVHSLHTTHSPGFLGLNRNSGFWNRSNYGEGVIIGVIDSGIAPDHPSFSDDADEGLPPPPAKWKGKCEFRSRASCNNKLIGARNFIGEPGTPSDEQGHGTHTASTAAGNFVRGANIFGNAGGTAVGIAPRAHLATYKVCGTIICAESDIVAAMDAAIHDGVDILSMSLGSQPFAFWGDNIAIGAYRAIQKGIFVSCSVGNSGPTYRTSSNEAPWILTVGASTIDRKLRATAVLGNNEELDGESAFQPKDFPSTKLELVHVEDCDKKLKSGHVRGKIVLCRGGGYDTRVDKGRHVKDAGGAAMIVTSPERRWNNTLLAELHVLPATHITYTDGLKVRAYLSSTPNPTATISFKGTIIGDDRAPVVAGFSSRGPSVTSPGILKPDIIGPGVNILAAWHLSVENKTETRSNFNMIAGTSISCPHLSGVAALLKSAHPHWSPAAIKSAIMTTADQVDIAGDPIEDQNWSPADIFAVGSGHVNPSRANDPGLVYDICPDDYVPYLCGLNYTSRQVGHIVKHNVDCSKDTSIPEAQLNYPSFSIVLGSNSQTYSRTVTNVGNPNSTYDVKIVAPFGVIVTVNPVRLRFSKLNQKLEYNVTFIRSVGRDGYSQGFLSWNSASRSVRSPIAIVFE